MTAITEAIKRIEKYYNADGDSSEYSKGISRGFKASLEILKEEAEREIKDKKD